MLSVYQVRTVLEAFDSLANHPLQAELKPICEKVVNEYLAQGCKSNLTPYEIELLREPNNKIMVIKMLRERTGCSLADAMVLARSASLNHAPQIQCTSEQPS